MQEENQVKQMLKFVRNTVDKYPQPTDIYP